MSARTRAGSDVSIGELSCLSRCSDTCLHACAHVDGSWILRYDVKWNTYTYVFYSRTTATACCGIGKASAAHSTFSDSSTQSDQNLRLLSTCRPSAGYILATVIATRDRTDLCFTRPQEQPNVHAGAHEQPRKRKLELVLLMNVCEPRSRTRAGTRHPCRPNFSRPKKGNPQQQHRSQTRNRGRRPFYTVPHSGQPCLRSECERFCMSVLWQLSNHICQTMVDRQTPRTLSTERPLQVLKLISASTKTPTK